MQLSTSCPVVNPRPRIRGVCDEVPFTSAEEAWFWFMAAWAARADGARIVARQGAVSRPCEPIDILRVVDHLRRQRILVADHLLVLRHYGERHMAPDQRRVKEQRAARLWREAMAQIQKVLERKGIVHPRQWWQGGETSDTPDTRVRHA